LWVFEKKIKKSESKNRWIRVLEKSESKNIHLWVFERNIKIKEPLALGIRKNEN
jgi:hypothetical protein